MKSVRAILRKEFPISRRVVVSIEDADEAEDFGACWMEGDTIRISVRESEERGEMAHTLIHEWAHARLADKAGKICSRHSVAWAREYGAIYQRVFGSE